MLSEEPTDESPHLSFVACLAFIVIVGHFEVPIPAHSWIGQLGKEWKIIQKWGWGGGESGRVVRTLATLTEASRGLKVATTCCASPGCRRPAAGVKVKGAFTIHAKSTATSPLL